MLANRAVSGRCSRRTRDHSPSHIRPHGASLYAGVGKRGKEHALSAPPSRTRRTIGCRFSKCRVSKCPAPHVLANSTMRPARISKPCRRVYAARTACPPAHTRASPGAHRNRSASPPHRTPPRRRTARPPAQDIQQTASGPENAAHGVCALSLASPPPTPQPRCASMLPAGVLAAGVWCGGVNFHFFAVLPFFGPETPLIPYFPRTEIGKNQKNHDSGTGHVFSCRVGIWGRTAGSRSALFFASNSRTAQARRKGVLGRLLFLSLSQICGIGTMPRNIFRT